jgi:hypothetical protein
MEMMLCPHCGAGNSTKREYCFQCEGALRGEPKKAEVHEYVATCVNCSHAAIFPPPGHKLTPDQVWCMERDESVPSAKVAGDCFSEAFGWRREEILD